MANSDVVAMLESLLDDARNGDITDFFIVIRDDRGLYDSLFCANDLDDLILQVRTEVILAQIPPKDPATH